MEILLVDDHDLLRRGVRDVLRGLDPTATVHEAGSCDEALQFAQKRFDFILLDLWMPGTTGLAALDRVKAAFPPEAPVIVLSAEEDPDLAKQALDRGAAGYIPKSAKSNLFLHALGIVINGGVYIPSQVLKQTPAPAHDVLDMFTDRQREVFLILVRGEPNKIIARELKISEGAAKTHVSNILQKLRMNRVQAVRAYSKLADAYKPA